VGIPLGTYAFETAEASKSYSITLGTKFDISNTLRTYSIRNATLNKGTKALFRISPDFNSLIFTNQGAVPVVFDVEFGNTMVSSKISVGDTIPKGRRTNITINPFATLVLTPLDWLNLSQNTIKITEEICGNQVCGEGENSTTCPVDCPAVSMPTVSDNLHLSESTTLVTGTYSVSDQGEEGVLIIEKDGVTLDCNGSKLMGNGSGTGILVKGKNNVVIKNCLVENYGVGIKLDSSSNVKVQNSSVTTNQQSGILNAHSANSEVSKP
jgi:parallel beta-helix repeat protein